VPVRLAVAAFALLCALAVPLRLSADVWAYAAYGALLAHGADPWAHAYRAADVARYADPLLTAALGAWDGSLPRDVYGPLFTVAAAAVVGLTRPFGPAGAVLAFRALAAAALLACIALAGRTRPRLAALLAFHPVALWSAAEGHNDVFWLALVLAADRVTGVPARLGLLVAASAVKAIAAVPLATALALLRRRHGFGLAPLRIRGPAAAAALGVLALAYGPLAWSVVRHGLDRGDGAPRVSLLHGPALSGWSGSPVPAIIAALLAVAAVAAVARALRADDSLGGAALLGWLALPSPEPWYALWLLPVYAMTGPTPAGRALLVATVTGVAAYAQDLVAGTTLHDPAFLGGMYLAMYALPLLVALAQPAPSPLPNAPPPVASPVATPSPAPQPAATTTPVPPAVPSATPSPFTYVVSPTPGPAGAPRIVEIALNDRVLHKGGMLLVRVTTSPDVTTLIARTLGHEIAIPLGAPGYFAGQQQLPSGIPFFLLGRDYSVEFVGTTGDGRSVTYTLPIRLER
jgi:hypothetical protein